MALHRFPRRFLPFSFDWIRGQKIKVDQGGSSQIKVAQGILRHFFMGLPCQSGEGSPPCGRAHSNGDKARPHHYLLLQGEGINRRQSNTLSDGSDRGQPKLLPLHWGEGRGEGEPGNPRKEFTIRWLYPIGRFLPSNPVKPGQTCFDIFQRVPIRSAFPFKSAPRRPIDPALTRFSIAKMAFPLRVSAQ